MKGIKIKLINSLNKLYLEKKGITNNIINNIIHPKEVVGCLIKVILILQINNLHINHILHIVNHIRKINIIKGEDKIKMKVEVVMLVKVLNHNIMEEVADRVNMVEEVAIVDHIILILHKDNNQDLK